MIARHREWLVSILLTGSILSFGVELAAAQTINGKVLGGGQPIVNSTVTLWAANEGAPQQLGQARTGPDGGFALNAIGPASSASLYVIAKGGQPATNAQGGDNPAIALMTVIGGNPPATITINEMTTVASVWTHTQFLDGSVVKGPPLSLRIAAGNVPNFVDLQTGGWGEAIQSPFNGGETPTMANFATLADALSGCVTRVKPDACPKLYTATTPPKGDAPNDTLMAAQSIARYPWYQPQRVFGLISEFYQIPPGKNMRAIPFVPYLNKAPSAWVLPLKFGGGGYRAGGKGMFDSEGNLWVGDNFTVGWQGTDSLWQGNATKFDPNGKALSPSTTGFTGGGMEGGTFGLAVDVHNNAWFGTYGGKSIAVFDKNGKPLTPPEGITFGGRLGLMQGIIATPKGDVWALGISKDQLAHFPGGDPAKGAIVCEGRKDAEPCKSMVGPFHLAIDQQDRIWVTNGFAAHVTRFPASDPSKAEKFGTGWSPGGMAIDSQGNVWVTNHLGNGAGAAFDLIDDILVLKTGGNADEALTMQMHRQTGRDGGSVTLLRPDGSQFPGSPFTGGGLPAPFAAVVDGNDNVWVSNLAMSESPIAHLCGARTENCPPGLRTGDQISPPGGYVGGGLQRLTDLAINPAGDVWVMNNWNVTDSCFLNTSKSEALSTRCGGNGVTVFYGMAKPVRAPQIGPARQP
jgi:hypothetical protein